MPQIQEGMREDIAHFLPHAIKTAIQSYRNFSENEATDPKQDNQSKTFKDHHDACKIAIAHIKLLIELAKWADIPTEELTQEIEQAQLANIINAGNFELGR